MQKKDWQKKICSTSNSPDKKQLYKDGEEFENFIRIRQAIASKVPDFKPELQEFIRNHKDVVVRRGFYQTFWPRGADEIQEFFKKDGGDFVRAALLNCHMYRGTPSGVNTAFYEIVQECRSDEKIYGSSGVWRSHYEQYAEEYKKKNPELYSFDEWGQPINREEDRNEIGGEQAEKEVAAYEELLGKLESFEVAREESFQEITEKISTVEMEINEIKSIVIEPRYIDKGDGLCGFARLGGWILTLLVIILTVLIFK